MEASQPRLSEKYLRLQKARHPLLDKKTAVANDLELGDKFDTLMITGQSSAAWRQDGDVKDHRSADPYGPVRPAHPRRGGLRRPGV